MKILARMRLVRMILVQSMGSLKSLALMIALIKL